MMSQSSVVSDGLQVAVADTTRNEPFVATQACTRLVSPPWALTYAPSPKVPPRTAQPIANVLTFRMVLQVSRRCASGKYWKTHVFRIDTVLSLFRFGPSRLPMCRGGGMISRGEPGRLPVRRCLTRRSVRRPDPHARHCPGRDVASRSGSHT